jgi:hypothetical protein
MPDGRGHFLASWLGCPAKLVSFRYNRNRNRKKFRNYPKQKVFFVFFGIYRNWNVLILSVVSVQPKKNRKTERRGKGGRRRKGKGRWRAFRFRNTEKKRNKPKQTERGDYILSGKIPKQNRNCQCFRFVSVRTEGKKIHFARHPTLGHW